MGVSCAEIRLEFETIGGSQASGVLEPANLSDN